MKAEERAFLTVDLMRRDILLGLTGEEIKELIKKLTQAILNARAEAIEDCAAVAGKYVRLEAPLLPHEIAAAIRNLKEVNNEKNDH